MSADLPQPLSDPLLQVRWFMALIFCGMVVLNWSLSPAHSVGGFLLIAAGYAPLAIFVLSVLPNKPVNAVYLRSFANDTQSWPIRKAIQTALGGEYRLSGIRNPSRRLPMIFRVLAYTVFFLRYSTAKYMNLEAGADWKARLWRSLGDTRCAFVDVQDLTPFVREEVHLCYHCMGVNRVLFIGNSSLSEQSLRARVAEILGLDPEAAAKLHIAIWDHQQETSPAFGNALSSFLAQLPAGNAGLNTSYLPNLASSEMPAQDVAAAECQRALKTGQ